MISVIVPVYEVERYIIKCIDSILEQSFTDFELILVDDGSKDKSGAICDEYAKRDSRIKVIHQENTGLSGARNAGIRDAKGEWILFIDSDDYIAKNMLMDLYNAVINNNLLMAICNFECVTEEGKVTMGASSSPIKNEVLLAEEIFHKIYEKGGWFYVVAWNKIYHKSLLNNDFYPVGKLVEDEFVIAEVLYKAKKIVCIENKNYFYRVKRTGSITKSKEEELFLNTLEALKRRCDFFQINQMEELAKITRGIAFQKMKKLYMRIKKEKELETVYKKGEEIYKNMGILSFKEQIRWMGLYIYTRLRL